MYILLIALSIVAVAYGEDCPFVPASCPVDLENAMDVFYYDVNDHTSCQHQCNKLSLCSHFTQLKTPDHKHNKCFLFKSCDKYEDCEKYCVSGAEEPPFYDCTRENTMSETAE